MKRLVFFLALFLFLFLPFTFACAPVIDGVCEKGCETIDFDCLENPYAESIVDRSTEQLPLALQDNSLQVPNSSFQNTIALLPQQGSGQPSFFIQGELYVSSDSFSVPAGFLQTDRVAPSPTHSSFNFSILHLFIFMGALLCSYLIYIIFKRVHHQEAHHHHQKYVLHNYIKELRAKGLPDANIADLFIKRGYSQAYVSYLFKTLEHKP